jgi:DNA (cytosine-5)-methyltransferase 1
MKLKAADLFCCAGGAAMGLHRAGFDVTGWDVRTGLNYPFTRHIGCALEADLSGFDFVWASPPCQAHSSLRSVSGSDYECFIERVRAKLKTWGGPYVIENVVGAPLLNPVMLCGSSFNLGVRRHRLFESNIDLRGLPCAHASQPEPIDVSGTGSRRIGARTDGAGGNSRKPRNLEEAQTAMGIHWMSRRELSQAIPPAFSEFIGRQVMQTLSRELLAA